jgi:uncharacterized repeat protein (TIGR01451 family)
MKATRFACVLIGLLLVPAAVLAKPQIDLSISAQKEIVIVENGKEMVKRVPADAVSPGETIYYTIHYANTGSAPATDLLVHDPIPEGTAFIPGSASERGAEVTFSIDGGKTFKKPSLLTYEVRRDDGKTEKLVATPETYTHIRWKIKKIAAGERGALAFQVMVK